MEDFGEEMDFGGCYRVIVREEEFEFEDVVWILLVVFLILYWFGGLVFLYGDCVGLWILILKYCRLFLWGIVLILGILNKNIYVLVLDGGRFVGCCIFLGWIYGFVIRCLVFLMICLGSVMFVDWKCFFCMWD